MTEHRCSGWTGVGPCDRPARYLVEFGQRSEGACRAHLAQVAKRRLDQGRIVFLREVDRS